MNAETAKRWLLRRLLARVWPDLVIAGMHLPDVMECHVHTVEGETCPQCDGGHRHEWVRCIVLGKKGHFIGAASRCRLYGCRKCDIPGCSERRHHRSPHLYASGQIEQVGG